MDIVLASNVLSEISGEQTFFDNLSAKLTKSLEKQGFGVHHCAVPISSNPVIGLSDHYLRFPLLPKTYAELRKFENCGILHFLNASLAGAGLFLKNRFKIATVHQLGNSLMEFSPAGAPLGYVEAVYRYSFTNLDRKIYRSMDTLVACTPYQAWDLQRTYGLESSKVKTISPGVDVEYFKKVPAADLKSRFGCDEVVVYAGRHHERSKGVSYLIRAMEHIKRKGTKLVLIGDGPDRKNYEKLTRRLGLDDRIVFLGHISFAEKSLIQKSADVVAIPSLYDVFCIVFAESLACNTPVVAFDQPFWKGIYDDAGLFVDKSPESLAEGIEKVLDDRNLRKKLVQKGRTIVEKHDINKIADDYTQLYLELSS